MDLVTTYQDKAFSAGYNDFEGLESETGLRFQILRMEGNSEESISSFDYETAVLVVKGKGSFVYKDEHLRFDRPDWVKSNPIVVHFPAGDIVTLSTEVTSHFAVVSTRNSDRFDGKIYAANEIEVDHRGRDILGGACYRLVRLAFDRTIAPEGTKLVLGEVLNFPGKWSSYPPHHHEQPEIYYYEFSPSEGYGHGELGEQVFKIKHQNLLKITDSRDHSQVSAPGYYMYYVWAIRHMEDNPYTGFEFRKPYDKLLD